ncbi:hypothetical protein FHN55_21970 [Streptomyces sp. NP160]|nr:hypothetical protein FHN55_21970 [Streptomyces sp. NP160]
MQPVCPKGTYNCNLPSIPPKTKAIILELKSKGFFTKVVSKVPPKQAVKVVKVYRSIAWLFR